MGHHLWFHSFLPFMMWLLWHSFLRDAESSFKRCWCHLSLSTEQSKASCFLGAPCSIAIAVSLPLVLWFSSGPLVKTASQHFYSRVHKAKSISNSPFLISSTVIFGLSSFTMDPGRKMPPSIMEFQGSVFFLQWVPMLRHC